MNLDQNVQLLHLGDNDKNGKAVNGKSEIIPIPALQKYKVNTGLRPPKRTGYGTSGRSIKLRANHLKVNISLANFYHYDIDIVPEKIPKHLKRKVFQEILQKDYFKNIIAFFDGNKNFYTIKKLPITNQEDIMITGNLVIEDRKLDYKCKIKFACEVNMYQLQEFWEGKLLEMPQDPLQALDVAMKHIPNLTHVPVGRSLYSMPLGNSEDLGDGCELWRGRFQSIRPTQWKMTLNVDLAATAFYKPIPIIDFMSEFFKMRGPVTSLNPRQRVALQKELKNLKVCVNHQKSIKRTYVVREITKVPASQLTFTIEREGQPTQTLSVADYFSNQYGRSLKYPNLPCLRVGSMQKKTYLPMEVCDMKVGQKKNNISDTVVANMIRFTAIPAPQRERQIMERIAEAKFNDDPIMKACGISVDNKLIELDGRVIEPPSICYQARGSNSKLEVTPRNGVWDMRQGEKFVKPVDIKNWALINYEDPRRCPENSMKNFFQQLSKHAQDVGMTFNPVPVRVNNARQGDQADQIFMDYISEAREKNVELQLIVVILPGRSQIYADIKRLGDVRFGIVTQCIQSKNVGRPSPALLVNILLKLNVKCDGINDIVNFPIKTALFKDPVIILGADVTHPMPGDLKMPSIAAVVASMDSYPQKYTACVKAQGHRVEIIENLTDMMVILLRRFYQATRVKPSKIIFYRDGVSEGQFLMVLQYEVCAIQEACRRLQNDYQPLITFAVVQKRHHTRLFCVNPRDACGKSQNVPPGTIVDKGIVHPRETDFYLCSHAGIQGTSRPTHYHILWDDNNFKPDDFQNLTYALCHTYVRCNRAVSIPAPAYYAHHVAFRARYHMADILYSDSASTIAPDQGDDKPVTMNLEKLNEAITIDEKCVKKMYFA